MKLKFGKEHYELTFDKIFTTGSGQLLGVEIRPAEEYSHVSLLIGALEIYDEMHEKLGHANENVVYTTANHYGIKIKEKKNQEINVSTVQLENIESNLYQNKLETKHHI